MNIFGKILLKKIRYYLVFFCILNLLSCKKENSEEITVNYKEGIAISVSLFSDYSNKDFDVFLKKNASTSVLGDFFSEGNTTTFQPVVPFEAGQTYILSYGKNLAKEFTIEKITNSAKPEILAIYPTVDTVPQNLLKMYIQFSQSMQEVGKALDYVKVRNLSTGQEESVFLDLPTELWNKDHTMLTLWLDPGRIKTGLIPNQEQGLPLIKGNRYEIRIAADWRNAQGTALGEEYTKIITVIEGDDQRPALGQWALQIPESNTTKPLRILFNEPMDAMLGESVLKISYLEKDEHVEGSYELTEAEGILEFIPDKAWANGRYSLITTRHLEDLAGNTPMHLFDTEVRDSEDMKHEKYIDARSFTIE